MTYNWLALTMLLFTLLLVGGFWVKGKDVIRPSLRTDDRTLAPDKVDTTSSIITGNEAPQACRYPMLVLIVSEYDMKMVGHTFSAFKDCRFFSFTDVSDIKTFVELFDIDAVIVATELPVSKNTELLTEMNEYCKTLGVPCFKLASDASLGGLSYGKILNDEESLSMTELQRALQLLYQQKEQALQAIHIRRQALLPQQGVLMSKREQALVMRMWKVLGKHFAEEHWSVDDATNLLGISKRHLNRKMEMLFGVSFPRYLQAYRLIHARDLLKRGYNVTTTTFEVGYACLSTFTKAYSRMYGYSPSKEKQKGMTTHV